jgi:hypothetical protein
LLSILVFLIIITFSLCAISVCSKTVYLIHTVLSSKEYIQKD